MQCAAGGAFGVGQQVALFIAEGDHAVDVGRIRAGGQGVEAHAQHAGRVAEVEEVVLADLDGGEVAGVVLRDGFAEADGGGDVSARPGGDHFGVQPFARGGRVGQRAGDVGGGFLGASGASRNIQIIAA